MAFSSADARRVAELQSFAVLDTGAEEAFDSITRLVADACEVPVALLSFVDTDRQWFKSRVGLSVCETSRDVSFCSRAIAAPGDMFIVPDTLLEPDFRENPLVTGDPFVRFYAGAPIVSPAGLALGTLCVIDMKPRVLTPKQLAVLRAAANNVLALLTCRRAESELRDALKEGAAPGAGLPPPGGPF